MNTRPVAPLVALLVLYILVVRGIFAWLLFATRGDTFLLVPRFAPSVPQSWLPYVVGVACVVGLATRQVWGWWLTAAALAYEVVALAPVVTHWNDLSAVSIAGWFKVLWLLAMASCLWWLRAVPAAQRQSE